MSDIFITLKEAAEFEGIGYKALAQRIARNPQQYKTQTQAREGGGKDQVLISVSSLSRAKGRWEGCHHRPKSKGDALVCRGRP